MKIEQTDENTVVINGRVFKAEEEKRGKWVPEDGEEYFYVDGDGSVLRLVYTGHAIDKKLLEVGNDFKTKEEAINSLYYFVFNSKYHYWIPGMITPNELPEGCEFLYDKWVIDNTKPKGWSAYLRRWPK